MGRKWPSDMAEKRRAKRSERERALAEAHAERLAMDPQIERQLREIESQLADGTFDISDAITAEEFRRRYLEDTPDA